MNELIMSDKGVRRTAPATLGLFDIYIPNCNAFEIKTIYMSAFSILITLGWEVPLNVKFKCYIFKQKLDRKKH